jgi:hypothetical protein
MILGHIHGLPLPPADTLVTTGLDAVHGFESEHKPCFLRESNNPFEAKLLTRDDKSEALPAKMTVTLNVVLARRRRPDEVVDLLKEYALATSLVFAHFVLKWLHHPPDMKYVTLLQADNCLHESRHFDRLATCPEEARNNVSPSATLHDLPWPAETKFTRPDVLD